MKAVVSATLKLSSIGVKISTIPLIKTAKIFENKLILSKNNNDKIMPDK